MLKDVVIPVVPVVIDTNILVPSLYRTTPLLYFIKQGNLLPIWNQFIFNEALEMAEEMWPWYSVRLEIECADVLKTLYRTFDVGHCVPDMPETWPPVSTDRDDDPFLWAALQGGAEYIISYDRRHMLKLGAFQSIPIGTPKQFFDWVKITHPMDAPEIDPEKT